MPDDISLLRNSAVRAPWMGLTLLQRRFDSLFSADGDHTAHIRRIRDRYCHGTRGLTARPGGSRALRLRVTCRGSTESNV